MSVRLFFVNMAGVRFSSGGWPSGVSFLGAPVVWPAGSVFSVRFEVVCASGALRVSVVPCSSLRAVACRCRAFVAGSGVLACHAFLPSSGVLCGCLA